MTHEMSDGLGAYLEQNCPEITGVTGWKKFSDGQSNPTYMVTANTGKFVLRAKPPGELLKSAHQVDREFRVMAALEHTNVAVPKMIHLAGDDNPLGRMFFVMKFVEGRILWDAALPKLNRLERSQVYDSMNETLANLHSVDPKSVGLVDFGKSGNYFERQTSRWIQQYRASELVNNADMDRIIPWLEENLPADDGQASIVHGDYRLDNMILRADLPKVIAVLDWELSTLGHPMADLAYQCMQWHLPNAGNMRGLAGIDRAAHGIPTEEEYVAKYCKRRGINEIQNWDFYLTFCFFRLAAIITGVVRRAQDGNASNPEKARKMAAAIPVLARLATQNLDQG